METHSLYQAVTHALNVLAVIILLVGVGGFLAMVPFFLHCKKGK